MRLRLLGPGVSITQPLPWLAASPGWTHPRVGAGDGPTTAPGRRGGDTRPMERRTGPSLLPAAELDTWSQQRTSYPDQHQHSDTCAAGHVPTTLDTRAAVPSRDPRGCRAVPPRAVTISRRPCSAGKGKVFI